jgi:hypothetical protein
VIAIGVIARGLQCFVLLSQAACSLNETTFACEGDRDNKV